MKIHLYIEKYFGLFLIAGIVLGLLLPVYSSVLMSFLKPLLMMMLFLVFLKTDVSQIIKSMKNYRLTASVVVLNIIIIPLFFYFITNLFDHNLAVGALLLTAMPAAIASPALTDISKGNTALSASIVIVSSLMAPLTVPFLFWIIRISDLTINPWWLLVDISVIIIIPLMVSQIVKRYKPRFVQKNQDIFTSVNVFILAAMVYVAIASQRDAMMINSLELIVDTGFLYLLFILLHVMGYFIGHSKSREDKIAITVVSAYRNNGLAIVLAAVYFEPPILILMVLTELPWNTLLIPFRRIATYYR
jgi:BASS family bile acid:Na+ symporter